MGNTCETKRPLINSIPFDIFNVYTDYLDMSTYHRMSYVSKEFCSKIKKINHKYDNHLEKWGSGRGKFESFITRKWDSFVGSGTWGHHTYESFCRSFYSWSASLQIVECPALYDSVSVYKYDFKTLRKCFEIPLSVTKLTIRIYNAGHGRIINLLSIHIHPNIQYSTKYLTITWIRTESKSSLLCILPDIQILFRDFIGNEFKELDVGRTLLLQHLSSLTPRNLRFL